MVASFELAGSAILLQAEQEFQLQQIMDILRQKLVKPRVDVWETDWGLPLQFTNFRD